MFVHKVHDIGLRLRVQIYAATLLYTSINNNSMFNALHF